MLSQQGNAVVSRPPTAPLTALRDFAPFFVTFSPLSQPPTFSYSLMNYYSMSFV